MKGSALAIEAETLSSKDELLVEIEQDDVGVWALAVTLLLEGLTEQVRVTSLSDGETYLLRLQKDEHSAKRTVVSRAHSGGYVFALALTQARYMQVTLLRAYRDGMAEVNHVHVEGTLDGSAFDLTAFFKVARPPMSSDDAKRLMG